MGLITAFKRAFNLGGVAIEVHGLPDRFALGDAVAGEVVLRGGDYDVAADWLRVTLEEFWTESRGSGKNRRTVTVTRTEGELESPPVAVAAGAAWRFPFALALPGFGRISDLTTGWRLRIALSVPGAIDPSELIVLTVGPSAPLAHLAALFADPLQWRWVDRSWSWDRHANALSFRVRPPDELHADFDHLDVVCRHDGSNWLIDLRFDLQEKGWGDRLRAIVDADKAVRQLRFSEAELDPNDPAATRGVATRLAQAMQDIVRERNPGG